MRDFRPRKIYQKRTIIWLSYLQKRETKAPLHQKHRLNNFYFCHFFHQKSIIQNQLCFQAQQVFCSPNISTISSQYFIIIKMSGLTPSFQALKEEVGNNQFSIVRDKIYSMTIQGDIVDLLLDYMAKPMAKQLAANLLKEMNKDNVVASPIDKFLSNLRKTNIPEPQIGKIRYLIENGKKLAVKKKLMECTGYNGQNFFKEVMNFMNVKIASPLKGSEFIQNYNDLDLYRYNQNFLLQSEKANAKAMIVFGQTGCGKSTFLNAIVNYIAEVEMEDTFRYLIIVEKNKKHFTSTTKAISDYYIKNPRTGQVYRLIDTPGFGDTDGYQTDKNLVKMISEKLKKELQAIHCVLFVMKSSTNKVTTQQQYVFQSVMDIFAKQIAPNFVFIFTFSDSGKSQVLPSVMDQQLGFGKYWNQIIEPKYIEVNNCAIFQKIDEKDNIKTGFWNIGIQGIEKLLTKVNCMTPKSLTQSKDMILTKERLNNQIENTAKIIEQSNSKRENIKSHIQSIVFHKKQIDNNKDFTYPVVEDQWYNEYTSSNVTKCYNMQCKTKMNCHLNCSLGNGQSKKDCAAMSNGYCTICGHHYQQHQNSNYMAKVRWVTINCKNTEKYRKYDLSTKQMTNAEAALKVLFLQLENEMKIVIKATRQMAILQQKLVNVQMTNKKPQSTKAYLLHMIQKEKNEQTGGYLKRIEGFTEAIKQLELHDEIIKGNGNSNAKKTLDEINKENARKIIDSVQPGYYEKLKNIIFS